jgi:hypothetical protein
MKLKQKYINKKKIQYKIIVAAALLVMASSQISKILLK